MTTSDIDIEFHIDLHSYSEAYNNIIHTNVLRTSESLRYSLSSQNISIEVAEQLMGFL
jgi:hypothetical protein